MTLGEFRQITSSLKDEDELWLEQYLGSIASLDEITIVSSDPDLPKAVILQPKVKGITLRALAEKTL